MKILKIILTIFAFGFPSSVLAQPKEEVVLISKKAKNLEISLTVDKAVNAMLATRQFARESAADYIKQAEESAKDLRKEKTEQSASYDGTFKAVWASDSHLSLLGEHFSFGGGAHGSTTYQSQIFDLINKKTVALTDILEGIDKLTPASRKIYDYIALQITLQKAKNEREENPKAKPLTPAEITKKLRADEYLKTEKMTKDWLVNYVFITAETVEEFQKAPVKTPVVAIRLLYAQYEMGAYAEGVFDVNLPVALIKDFIKPEWRKHFRL